MLLAGCLGAGGLQLPACNTHKALHAPGTPESRESQQAGLPELQQLLGSITAVVLLQKPPTRVSPHMQSPQWYRLVQGN